MKRDWTPSEIGNVLGITERAVRKRAQLEKWPAGSVRRVRGGGKKIIFNIEDVPTALQTKLIQHNQLKESESIQPIADRSPVSGISVSGRQSQIGLARADLVRFYEKHLDEHGRWGSKKQAKNRFMKAYNSGELYPQLFAILGPVSWQSIERWKKSLRKHGDALKLAPKRGFARRGQHDPERRANADPDPVCI